MTVVAIDGPTGSGKSSVARGAAERLGYVYLDTGAMYRAVGLLATEAGAPLEDEAAVVEVAAAARLHFDPAGRVWVGDRDVSGLIRSLEMGEAASVVSALPEVRRLLVARQREIASGADVVMEGRDIGTNVFPDAEIKIFLTARPEVRAARRTAELRALGEEVRLDDVMRALEERDRRDRERDVAPLRQAPDAVEVDSSDLTLDEAIDAVVAIARREAAS